MENGRKCGIVEWCVKIAPKYFLVALVLCAIYLVIGEIVFPSERDENEVDYQIFEADWYHVHEDGSRELVEIPGKVDAEWGEVVTLVTTIPENVEKGDYLCFRPIWQDVAIYIDGELRQEHDLSESRPFGINSAFRYVLVRLTDEDAGKELVYELVSSSKYAGMVKTVYIGERSSLWIKLIYDASAKSVAALCLGIMCIFCLLVCYIIKIVFKKPLELRYLAWAVFLCAWWMLSEMEFRQLLVKNVSIWTCTTYWSLMLIGFPLLLYVNEIQKKRYQKLFVVSFVYSGILFIVGTLLQVFDIVQFVSQLPFIHGGLIFSILCVIGTLTRDLFTGRIKDYMMVGIGIYGMLVSAVFEMVLYYMQANVSIGTVLAVGLMFLLVMAIIKTGQDMLQVEKKKQEAIVARDAQTKFLANMSHEIRTPINAVIGMNEMILRENKDEMIQEYAQNIQRASSMLLELVNDILDFSKIESGQLEIVEEPYYFGNVIQDEKLLLESRIGNKPIDVHFDIDSRLPSKLVGDEVRVKQILTNLLSNATKYTEKGSITVSVSFQWINEEKVSLCIKVKDTGMGIKEEDMPTLFNEFRRLDIEKNHNVEGSGLGLNIVHQLVTLMGGDIRVESKYGKGSTFTIIFSQGVEDKSPIGSFGQMLSESKDYVQVAKNSFKAPEAKILVVDDNAMNLTLMKALFKRTEMQVDAVQSGMQCIRFTRQKKYDLILMDHMMPKMDGVETLHKLRGEEGNPNKDTAVIALTANAVAGCREMYLEYGFNDYFSKPIQADKLDELIMQYIPSELIYTKEKQEEMAGQQKVQEALLEIDEELGLSYCMHMRDIYCEMLKEFCNQAEDYLPKLEKYMAEEGWKDYAIIAHALKGNALNIGATKFSELSLQQEMAAKAEQEEAIKESYTEYVATLRALMAKIKENYV